MKIRERIFDPVQRNIKGRTLSEKKKMWARDKSGSRNIKQSYAEKIKFTAWNADFAIYDSTD